MEHGHVSSQSKNIFTTIPIYDDAKKNSIKIVSDIPVNVTLKKSATVSSLSKNDENMLDASNIATTDQANGNTLSFPLDIPVGDYLIDTRSISLQLEIAITALMNNFCEKISTKMGELTFAMRTVSDRLDGIERIINQLPGQNKNHDEFVALLPLETIEGVTEFEEQLIGDVVPRLMDFVSYPNRRKKREGMYM